MFEICRNIWHELVFIMVSNRLLQILLNYRPIGMDNRRREGPTFVLKPNRLMTYFLNDIEDDYADAFIRMLNFHYIVLEFYIVILISRIIHLASIEKKNR
jgi:hypothetical protein